MALYALVEEGLEVGQGLLARGVTYLEGYGNGPIRAPCIGGVRIGSGCSGRVLLCRIRTVTMLDYYTLASTWAINLIVFFVFGCLSPSFAFMIFKAFR